MQSLFARRTDCCREAYWNTSFSGETGYVRGEDDTHRTDVEWRWAGDFFVLRLRCFLLRVQSGLLSRKQRAPLSPGRSFPREFTNQHLRPQTVLLHSSGGIPCSCLPAWCVAVGFNIHFIDPGGFPRFPKNNLIPPKNNSSVMSALCP